MISKFARPGLLLHQLRLIMQIRKFILYVDDKTYRKLRIIIAGDGTNKSSISVRTTNIPKIIAPMYHMYNNIGVCLN